QGLVCEFGSKKRGVTGDAVGGSGRAAVGSEVGDAAVVTRAASPRGAGWPDEGVVERVAGDVADFAAAPRRQRHTVEGVGAMPCDVGESGVLVDAEVVGVVDGRDELRRSGRIEGANIDGHAHEHFLRGRRVVEVAGLRPVAYAVDTRLGWGRNAAVGVERHGVVGEPQASSGTAAVVCEIDTPDEPSEAVGYPHHVRTKQTAAVEAAHPV